MTDSKSDKINLQSNIEYLIDTHFKKSDKHLKHQIINSCMNKCVNSFNGEELLLSERNCLQTCFYNVMENYYITKLN